MKPDCDLAEAVIDHTAARLRDAVTWMSDDAPTKDPLKSLAYSAKLPMQKMLRI